MTRTRFLVAALTISGFVAAFAPTPAFADGYAEVSCGWVGQVGSTIMSGDVWISANDNTTPKVAGGAKTWSNTTTCPTHSATGYYTEAANYLYKWGGSSWVGCSSNWSGYAVGPSDATSYSECADNTVLNRNIGTHRFWVSGSPYDGYSQTIDV